MADKIKRPHKFIVTQNPGMRFSGVIFCEHCGLVAFVENDTNNSARQAEAMKGCPLSPYLTAKEQLKVEDV